LVLSVAMVLLFRQRVAAKAQDTKATGEVVEMIANPLRRHGGARGSVNVANTHYITTGPSRTSRTYAIPMAATHYITTGSSRTGLTYAIPMDQSVVVRPPVVDLTVERSSNSEARFSIPMGESTASTGMSSATTLPMLAALSFPMGREGGGGGEVRGGGGGGGGGIRLLSVVASSHKNYPLEEDSSTL
jgi:hypothetical protein